MPTLQHFDSIMQQIAADFNADPHHRLRSWDHAHEYWQIYVADEVPNSDHAALNLAFYLASFGMYRASGDLFERDYKVLVPAAEFLRKKNRTAWNDCLFSQKPTTELASELKDLSIELSEQLTPGLIRPGKPKEKINPSDTLLSKILLVTLDCMPAIDDQVKAALRAILGRNYLSVDCFAAQRLIPIIELARENRLLIERGRKTLGDECAGEYPLNRVFDLYLWRRGAKIVARNKKNRS